MFLPVVNRPVMLGIMGSPFLSRSLWGWRCLSLLGVLFHREVPALLVYTLMYMGLGLHRRARPLGGGRRGALSSWPLGSSLITRTCACWEDEHQCSIYYCCMLPYVLASVSLPSLHGYHVCMVNWANGGLWGNYRQKHGKTFSPS